MRDRLRTLLVFSAFNLVLSSLLSIATLAGSVSLGLFIDSFLLGQATALGAAVVLIPTRRFLGLAVLALTVIIQAAINVLIQGWFDTESWWTRSELFFGSYSFLVAAVLLPFRFILGWRLIINEPDANSRPGQFGLGDILEWMTCIAVTLAFYSRVGSRLSLVDLALILPWPILIIIPAVRIVLARPGPTFAAVLLLAAWSVGVCIASWMTDLRYVRLMALLTTWKLSANLSAAFLAAVIGNLLILRWAGLHWQASTKLQCASPATT